MIIAILDLILGISISVAGLILIGLFIDFNHKYLGPYRLKRRLLRPPLSELKKIGFVQINEEYYSGLYNKYLLNIGFNWNSKSTMAKPCIWYEVYFKEKANGLDYKRLNKTFKKGFWFSKQKIIYWKSDSIYSEHEYTLVPPHFNTLITDIDYIINVLRIENLKSNNDVVLPITYTQQSWVTPFGYFKKFIK